MTLPEEFLTLLQTVKGKRARIVVEHILEHDSITTEDLETRYGYKHPPRAIRDVREQGIPIETFRVKNSQGRDIAAYRFGNPDDAVAGRIGGRRSIPKSVKSNLIIDSGTRCLICLQTYEARYLQVDHRIPYEVAGDMPDENFMLICPSCNRSKSWSCEQCENWQQHKQSHICQRCYWASPDDYDHIAMEEERRVTLIWRSEDLKVYDQIQQLAASNNQTLDEYILSILERYLSEK